MKILLLFLLYFGIIGSMEKTLSDNSPAEPYNSTTKKFFKKGLSFGILRGISNATWIGGTVASIAVQEKLGVPWQVAAPLVGGTVASIELYGSGVAERIFNDGVNEYTDKSHSSRWERARYLASRATRDAVGLGYSAWAGAMSAVELNNTLRLQSNRKRRVAQSAAYGAGVASWSLPFARKAAISSIEFALEHPLEGAVGGLAISGILYAGMECAKKVSSLYVNTPESVDEPIAEQ